MDKSARFIQVRDELNQKSTSLCLAKWKQVTILLQNGHTHSCHHPVAHKIPLRELETNPSALHNTKFKKFQRKMMLENVRPSECDYCWRIEDASPDNLSDRVYKSADEWAHPHFEEVLKIGHEENVNPSYVEVSFGNECHFKCMYCSPPVSSAILSEYLASGHYKSLPYFDLDLLKRQKQYPYLKDEHNPYVEAFWKWWPDLAEDLEVFRITGGEPLLNPNTFQFLETIIKKPLPKLDLAINSNLCVPDGAIKRFTQLSRQIVENNLIKKFEVYTSIDTWGPQAEYIRNGLSMEKFIKNVRYVLDELPGVKIVFMCTFNAFSAPGFENFLKELRELKLSYKKTEYTTRILLSTSYLRYPKFQAANVLPKHYISYVEKALDFMLRHSMGPSGFEVFSEFEISQLRRIVEWLHNNDLSEDHRLLMLKDLQLFVSEYDARKGLDFHATFPEFSDLFA
jgi:organic radical activating enzyme